MKPIIAADLYDDVPPHVPPSWRDLLPGLTVVGLGTLAAGFMADHYGAPLTLMALLLGLALNFLSTDARLHAGLGFASRVLLRWGIVLVGTRVTFSQILGLGPVALLAVAATIGLTMATGLWAARKLGFDSAFGILAGGSVAICGASAAMALSATLGSKRISEAQLTLVLVGISAMSAAAMLLYPVAAHLLVHSDVQAGFLLGASIHDVAQALGAGYAYSDEAGQIATIVKLTRVALLAPVLALVSLFMPAQEGRFRKVGMPWFVTGFFLVAGVSSTGAIPSEISNLSSQVAAAMLAAAVTATAIRSPLPKLMEAGHRPLLVILAATLAAFMLAIASALLTVK